MILVGPLTNSLVNSHKIMTIDEYMNSEYCKSRGSFKKRKRSAIQQEMKPYFDYPITHIFLISFSKREKWIKVFDNEYKEHVIHSGYRIMAFKEEEFALFLLRFMT